MIFVTAVLLPMLALIDGKPTLALIDPANVTTFLANTSNSRNAINITNTNSSNVSIKTSPDASLDANLGSSRKAGNTNSPMGVVSNASGSANLTNHSAPQSNSYGPTTVEVLPVQPSGAQRNSSGFTTAEVVLVQPNTSLSPAQNGSVAHTDAAMSNSSLSRKKEMLAAKKDEVAAKKANLEERRKEIVAKKSEKEDEVRKERLGGHQHPGDSGGNLLTQREPPAPEPILVAPVPTPWEEPIQGTSLSPVEEKGSNHTGNVTVFIHVSVLGDWEKILNGIVQHLARSPVMPLVRTVYFGVAGTTMISNVEKIIRAHGSFHSEIIAANNRTNLFEWLTLSQMKRVLRVHPTPYVLYMHTKGVRWTDISVKENIGKWRAGMEYWLLDRAPECMQLIDAGYDTAGILLINKGESNQTVAGERHAWHYSGNFWWASSKHLLSLPELPIKEVTDTTYGYWLTERWVLSKLPNMRVAELFHLEGMPEPHFYWYSLNQSMYVDRGVQLRTVNTKLSAVPVNTKPNEVKGVRLKNGRFSKVLAAVGSTVFAVTPTDQSSWRSIRHSFDDYPALAALQASMQG